MQPQASNAPPRLFETPANPCPPGAACFWAEGPDGVRLRVAHWPGPGAESRGTVIVFQGRTEFIEKYFETVGELQARGFAVLAFDWRGQGGSDRLLHHPLKGHVADFSHFLGDLDAVVERTDALCPKPWVLLAHSMGSAVALQALHDRRGVFARAAMIAPMTAIRVRHRAAVALLARVMPKTAFVPGGAKFDPAAEPFEGNLVTRDRARFRRNRGVLEAYPALGVGSPTWGWLNAAFAVMARVTAPAFLRAFDTPVLVLSAGEDLIIDNRSHEPLARALKTATALKLRGARHEILMETDTVRAEFWRAFDEFVAG